MAEEASTQARSSQTTRRKLAPRSGVWVHFTRFTDGDGNAKARCNRCRLVLGASTRNGTSTLRAHVRICGGDEAVPASNSRPPQLQLRGSPPPAPVHCEETAGTIQAGNPGRWEDLARMIALHCYESSFVEDEYFRSFVRNLSPEFEVPSREAIEEMCDGIFDKAREDLLSKLRSAPGRVSVATGSVETIEAGQVIYIACHFIDDEWKLRKLVLVATLVDGKFRDYEDGPILGVPVTLQTVHYVLEEVLSKHDIQDDRLSMVAYEISSDHNFQTTLLKDTNLSCSTTTYVDNVLHKIAGCLVPTLDVIEDFSDAVERLQLTRQKRQQLVSHHGLDNPWTYDERWYSCFCSIEVVHKEGCGSIDEEDANVLLFCNVWGAIYQAIQRISASTGPTSNLCLRELFHVREVLQSELARGPGRYFEGFKDTVDVLREMTDTLHKEIQDSYLIWSVPLALDPRYKLQYIEFSFQKVFGPKAAENLTNVRTRINDLYDYYIFKKSGRITGADRTDSTNAMMATTSASADPLTLEEAWNEHCRSQDIIMVDQDNSSCPETRTELHRYLQDRLVTQISKEDFDVLNWWKDRSFDYPTVALMAREALAMPTCSKISSEQIAQIRSIIRGYSKEPYGASTFSF